MVGRVCTRQPSRAIGRNACERDREKIVRSDNFRDRMAPIGVLPTVQTLAAFGEFQRAELKKWGKAVNDSGATVD